MKTKNALLWFIFVLVLGMRLWLVAGFNTYDYGAYFEIRQIEIISESKIPLFEDPLSYGGREIVYMPLFHLILGHLESLIPINLLLMIIPNLFASLLIFVVYFISKKLTDNEHASLFGAFIAGFIPLLFHSLYFVLNQRQELMR